MMVQLGLLRTSSRLEHRFYGPYKTVVNGTSHLPH
jgi:hypothetical protein